MCTGGKCRVSTLTGVSLCVSAPLQTDATLAPSCVALSSATPDPLRASSIGAATFTFCPQMVNVKPLNLVMQLCPQHPACMEVRPCTVSILAEVAGLLTNLWHH